MSQRGIPTHTVSSIPTMQSQTLLGLFCAVKDPRRNGNNVELPTLRVLHDDYFHQIRSACGKFFAPNLHLSCIEPKTNNNYIV